MITRGCKLVAKNPGYFYQYVDEPFVAHTDTAIKPLIPFKYWMRVKNFDPTNLTYDSFIQKRSGVIVQLKQDRTCELAAVQHELDLGNLLIETE